MTRRQSVRTAVVACLWCPAIAAQTLLDEIRSSTVLIEARFSDSSARRGYAWAAGRQFGATLLVTANSLVRGHDDPDVRSIAVFARGSPDDRGTSVELLEQSDPERNLAVLRLEIAREAPWASGCPTEVRSGTRGQVVNLVGRILPAQFQGAFGEGRARVQIPRAVADVLGAPVVVDSGIVGMLTSTGPPGEGDVISTLEIFKAFRRWDLPFVLGPIRACRAAVGSVSIDSLRRLPDGFVELVYRLLVPGELYVTMLNALSPTVEDENTLFAATDRAALDANRAGVLERLGDRHIRRVDDIMPICKPVALGVRAYWYHLTLEPKQPVISCQLLSDDRNSLDGFFFVNGRWVWIPVVPHGSEP